MAWWENMEVRTQRTFPTPKTQLPWISCHRTTMYWKETMSHLLNIVKKLDTCYPFTDLLEQFQQLKNQFAISKSNTPQSTPTEEQSQITDKIQHLTMVLQPVPIAVRNQCTRPCRCTWTPCMQHRVNPISSQPCSKISPHLKCKTLQSWKAGSWIWRLLLTS